MERLVHLINRYGEAIEADLHHHYHVDILDVFRGTISVRKVLNLIDRLPRTSHYVAALSDDESLAAAMEELPAATAPPVTEWPAGNELLAVIADRLMALINVQVAKAGGKPSKLQPYPRPITAAGRAAERRTLERRRANHARLVAALLPNQDP